MLIRCSCLCWGSMLAFFLWTSLLPAFARSNTDNKTPWIPTEGSSSRSNESWPLPPGRHRDAKIHRTNQLETVYPNSSQEFFWSMSPYTSLALLLWCSVRSVSRLASSEKSEKEPKRKKRRWQPSQKASETAICIKLLLQLCNFRVEPEHSARSQKHTKSILFDRNKAIQQCKKESQLSEVPVVSIGEAWCHWFLAQ